MKILVVEDEAKTRAYLRQGLEEAGFAVDTLARRRRLWWVLSVSLVVCTVVGDASEVGRGTDVTIRVPIQVPDVEAPVGASMANSVA